MAFWDDIDWGDVISAAVPAVISGGAALIGQSRSDAASRDAAQGTAALAEDASKILNTGYDQQEAELLAGSKALGDIYGRGYEATTDWLSGLPDVYENYLDDGLSDYSSILGSGLRSYGQGMGAANSAFQGYLNDGLSGYIGQADVALDEHGNIISGGVGDFEARYAPYEAGGQQALGALSRIVATDPNSLTLSQRRTLDDYRRGGASSLAASGLRGAGRAGVAAMNEGEAELRANLYDQNQQRSDAATQQLASMGYGATGAVAANRMAAANTRAGAALSTGLAKAGATLDNSRLAGANAARVGEAVAGKQYDTAKDTAGRTLEATDAAGRYRVGVGSDIGTLTNQYYGNLGNVAASEAQTRGNTAINKAASSAGAKTTGGEALLASGLSSGRDWGSTLGYLGGIVAQSSKDLLRNGGSSKTTS